MRNTIVAGVVLISLFIGVLIGCDAGKSAARSKPATAPQTASPAPAPEAKKVDTYRQVIAKPITVNAAQSPDGSPLTAQYAAIAICEAAGIPYQWEKSQSRAGDACKQYVAPVDVKNASAQQAITDLTAKLGIRFEIDDNGLYLSK